MPRAAARSRQAPRPPEHVSPESRVSPPQGERKGVNKYYPPDFNPEKVRPGRTARIPSRARRLAAEAWAPPGLAAW